MRSFSPDATAQAPPLDELPVRRSALDGKEVGVARQAPFAVTAFSQNCQCMAGPSNSSAALRRYSHLDVIAQVRPISSNRKFSDFARPGNRNVLHPGGRGSKLCLAERLLAGHQKDHIVSLQFQDGGQVPRHAGGHPTIDQRADCFFIIVHADILPDVREADNGSNGALSVLLFNPYPDLRTI